MATEALAQVGLAARKEAHAGYGAVRPLICRRWWVAPPMVRSSRHQSRPGRTEPRPPSMATFAPPGTHPQHSRHARQVLAGARAAAGGGRQAPGGPGAAAGALQDQGIAQGGAARPGRKERRKERKVTALRRPGRSMLWWRLSACVRMRVQSVSYQARLRCHRLLDTTKTASKRAWLEHWLSTFHSPRPTTAQQTAAGACAAQQAATAHPHTSGPRNPAHMPGTSVSSMLVWA